MKKKYKVGKFSWLQGYTNGNCPWFNKKKEEKDNLDKLFPTLSAFIDTEGTISDLNDSYQGPSFITFTPNKYPDIHARIPFFWLEKVKCSCSKFTVINLGCKCGGV